MWHIALAKRVLRYIAGTLHCGLFFPRISTLSMHKLCATVDSDWGGHRETRRSTTGFFLNHRITDILEFKISNISSTVFWQSRICSDVKFCKRAYLDTKTLLGNDQQVNFPKKATWPNHNLRRKFIVNVQCKERTVEYAYKAGRYKNPSCAWDDRKQRNNIVKNFNQQPTHRFIDKDPRFSPTYCMRKYVALGWLQQKFDEWCETYWLRR